MRPACRVALVVAVLMSSGCSLLGDHLRERRFVSHVTNRPALDFELDSLDGQKVRLSDYRGKRVLLAFWAFG